MWPLVLIAAGAALYWYQHTRESAAPPVQSVPVPMPAPTPLGPWDEVDFDVDLFPGEATPNHVYPPRDSVTPSATAQCEVIAVPHGFWEVVDMAARRWADAGLTLEEAYTRMLPGILPSTLQACAKPGAQLRGVGARFFQEELRRRIGEAMGPDPWRSLGWGPAGETPTGGGARDRAWPPPNRNYASPRSSRSRRLHGRLRA